MNRLARLDRVLNVTAAVLAGAWAVAAVWAAFAAPNPWRVVPQIMASSAPRCEDGCRCGCASLACGCHAAGDIAFLDPGRVDW